ncbi:hypothetical protein D4Q52_10420 [Rhodopseudomonas palustris]|uniref:Uncharacterized protein n=1 Tax=Rhodopseudomonas palustris TaxID=1076 RepID=A0A418VG44_RHOPL|nr:hypothetical protein D4Q52_10420 [Rhodopseudomonas palustris]
MEACVKSVALFRARLVAELAPDLRHGRACPGHPRLCCISACKAWMPGTRPGMTRGGERASFHSAHLRSGSEKPAKALALESRYAHPSVLLLITMSNSHA